MALYAVRRPDIKKVAVVPRPANGRRMILKEDGTDRVEIVAPILKADGDWAVAYAVIAEPGTPEGGGITADGQVAKGDDGQPISDVWDAESIRAACHSFARNGAKMTAGHFTDETAGSFVENFIAPADMILAGHPVKAGSWVLGLDPSVEMRAAINAGTMTGFSVEGDAVRELVAHSKPDAELELFVALAKAWDEAKHPRAPAGTSAGGKFASGQSGASKPPANAKQKGYLAAAAQAKKRADYWAGVIRALNASKASGKAKKAKLAAAKKAHAQAVAAQKAHAGRVRRHAAQHQARLTRHSRQHMARLKAQARAKSAANRAKLSAGKKTTATANRSQAQSKALALVAAKARAKASTRAAVRQAATDRVQARLAKGIGQTTQEPTGTKPLWGRPGAHLPVGIQVIATELISKGMPKDRAIATAIAAVKQGCATGKFGAVTLTPAKRAQACKAASEWEALKAA